MGWSVALLFAAVGAADAFDRADCAAPGRYEPQNGTDVLARAFDGPSFFEEGWWLNNKYVLEPPCGLKEGAAFACSVVTKIPRNGNRARILMVGDSISIRQFQDFKRRVQRCDADVAFLRADRLRERDLAKGQQTAYPVCKADALVVNTGAHYPDVRPFAQDLTKFLRSLNETCPTRPVTVFRTTPEGNPLCNSKQRVSDAADWEAKVWTVMNGSRPVPSALCGNQISGAPRHRRDVFPVTHFPAGRTRCHSRAGGTGTSSSATTRKHCDSLRPTTGSRWSTSRRWLASFPRAGGWRGPANPRTASTGAPRCRGTIR